jgi:ABC-type transport system substrate-binding protein
MIIILILLQSYFWVPTYEQQTRGNPGRLHDYIRASIGDATVLNPILSADHSSSEIEAKVFEGLIDRDEELRYRGRLATDWKIFEEAYFYFNELAVIPGGKSPDPHEVANAIREAKENTPTTDPALRSTLDNITAISVLPPKTSEVIRKQRLNGEKNQETEITFEVIAPARIKLVLSRVDQDLFQNLAKLLGETYFSTFPSERYISTDAALAKAVLTEHAREILPAVEHNPIIVFKLRPNVKFHDGHSFDAGDVQFTYEAIVNPKNLSPRIADYEPIKSVVVIDPLTVRVTYKRLYSPAMSNWAMGILPEHLLNSEVLKKEALGIGKNPAAFTMRQSKFNRSPIGCGPFVFREWKSDQYILLDRFEDYWEKRPNYKRFVYRIIPDLLTQEMEFYAGTIDIYGEAPGGVPPHQAKRLEKDPRYQSFSGTTFGYYYIGYNMRREPFDDPRVRRALGMAIDVNKIIKYVLYNQGERITGPFVKQTEYYNQTIEPLPYDPQRALRLLEEAGWKRNPAGWLEKSGKKLQFTLITNSGNDIRKAILAIAQDSWKQIGIDVRTDLLEWSVFIQERVDKADFDAIILGWLMGIDPDLYQIWHSSQTNPHQLNFVGFRDPEADDLIIKIRQEYDYAKQVAYCHRLHEIIAREQPYTFLFVRKWTAVLDKRIFRKQTDAQGKVVYQKITPTQTGSYDFHFNEWVKLAEMPVSEP